MKNEIEWTEELCEELRQLWEERPVLSTRQIGERMGCSKNCIIGKARRLGLPARPSPIIGRDPEVPRVMIPLRASKRTLLTEKAQPLQAPPSRPPQAPPRRVTQKHCCYPMWQNSERWSADLPNNGFCTESRAMGPNGEPKVYCEAHAARCFLGLLQPAMPKAARRDSVAVTPDDGEPEELDGELSDPMLEAAA